MPIYIQNLTLFFLIFLSFTVASAQTATASNTGNHSPATIISADRNETAGSDESAPRTAVENLDKAFPSANTSRAVNICDASASVGYEHLSSYVGDYWNRKTGECLIFENVPLLAEIKNADDEFGNRK